MERLPDQWENEPPPTSTHRLRVVASLAVAGLAATGTRAFGGRISVDQDFGSGSWLEHDPVSGVAQPDRPYVPRTEIQISEVAPMPEIPSYPLWRKVYLGLFYLKSDPR